MTMLSQYSSKHAQYYSKARLDIAPLLPENMGRTLEIGCGDGATLAWLRSTKACAYTVGVEYFPGAAEKARPHCDDLYVGPVEGHIARFDNESFDVVLCLDVLEHLAEPWFILKEIQRLLRPGGILICSLPNIRHVSVLLPLIFRNQWAYQDSGILDSTHLRFFTTKSAIDILHNASFKVEELARKMPPRLSASGAANFISMGKLADFVAPQFLIKAKK